MVICKALPKKGSRWVHHSGREYRVMFMADDRATVVYENMANGTRWARPIGLWHCSFLPDLNQPMDPFGYRGDPRKLSPLELDNPHIMPRSLWMDRRDGMLQEIYEVLLLANVAHINNAYPPCVAVHHPQTDRRFTLPLENWGISMLPVDKPWEKCQL